MGRKIPSKNKSITGWWVASIIERFEYDDEDKPNLRRRCRAWCNVVILKARDRNHAYRKAIAYGRQGKSEENDWVQEGTGRKCKLIFEGLASLLPVSDEFDEDGAEILFEDHENITVGRVKSWIRQKHELEVFDDQEV